MKYERINNSQRARMKSITKTDMKMEWMDPQIFNTLLGKLPKLRHYQDETNILEEVRCLEGLLTSYDYFSVDKTAFLKEIRSVTAIIRNKRPDWNGISDYAIQESILQQEFCLVSGEGGIGKSYFVLCLEEELSKRGIPHLCVYGKFLKDMAEVQAEEILSAAQSHGFVFIVDAINELSEDGHEALLHVLDEIKCRGNIRILLTYRTNSTDANVIERYKKLAKTEYYFQGVSFDSALEELLKSPAPDIYKYEDILYSNNALLLKTLCDVLSNVKLVDEIENGIASITFILESYVKLSIKRTFIGQIPSEAPKAIWQDIKKVAKWMYLHEAKEITEESLHSIIRGGITENYFISVMTQAGILDMMEHNGTILYFFLIDTLTDFLISRSLFDDLSGKNIDNQVELISKKVCSLPSLAESIIIALFDKFSPDYKHISELLERTHLIDSLYFSTLLKINFAKGDINKFLSIFKPQNSSALITTFGGYVDKPFNCVNYLNSYYKTDKHQLRELSVALSGGYSAYTVKGRLKNLLYFITLNDTNTRRYQEAFYFALWCCASPDKDIRYLAIKLIYEIIGLSRNYMSKLINEYSNIFDPYIKEAIIFILANMALHETSVEDFFRSLIEKEPLLTAKSIKRIATYLGDGYDYIKYSRSNLYNSCVDGGISDGVNEIFFTTNILSEGSLPFRYWGKNNADISGRFLSADKRAIIAYNHALKKRYSCVKAGICNGNLQFSKYIGAEKYEAQCLEENAFWGCFDLVVREIFKRFDEPLNWSGKHSLSDEFSKSLYMKCVDIAVGAYYGSLMCNYFTSTFATFNSNQNCIGFEVYDPIPDDEELFVATPIPIYQPFIEKLGDILQSQLEIPDIHDAKWARDVVLTRKNLLSLLRPIEIKGVKWALLSAIINIRDNESDTPLWSDSYDLYCCTSKAETIKKDGLARYRTIELETYTGPLCEYGDCSDKPWLCKRIKCIASNSDILDNGYLIFPPAELIRYFHLTPVQKNMSWVNEDGEQIIVCDNNKSSYYHDSVIGATFIREEYLDAFCKQHFIKYFAFTERYTKETGYADETSLHFELNKEVIYKEIPNNPVFPIQRPSKKCAHCPHGFNSHGQTKNDQLSSEETVGQTWIQEFR